MSGILRLEGLPFKITSEDIEEWIKDQSSIETSKIHMISNRLGRASGECFVEFKDASDAKSVMEACDEKTIGNSNRYVKIFSTDQDELNWQLQRQDLFKGKSGNDLFCVRMYGLPFRTAEYEIAKWFQVAKASCIDVQIHLNAHGKRSGDATAFFQTYDEAEKAMERNKDDMSGRYINLKLDTAAATFEMDEKSTSNFCLKMSGLPFRATEQEMKEFFLPQAKCTSIKVILNREGRPSGDAIASFDDEDSLQAALKKDHEHLGSRFIILSRYEEKAKMFSIRMGGLPYRAREPEIQDWFQPEATCARVKILKSRKDNRPNGEAIADFESKDEALNAMKKNKDYMGERFVILTPINF